MRARLLNTMCAPCVPWAMEVAGAYACTYIHSHKHMHMHAHGHARTCSHTHARTLTHTYTHTHTHTHIHTHTHTQTLARTHTRTHAGHEAPYQPYGSCRATPCVGESLIIDGVYPFAVRFCKLVVVMHF